MRPETLAPQAPKPCRLAPAAVLSGSDGDLAGSGTDLDVVAALDQVVVGASPVGLPGGPDADVVDGEPGGAPGDLQTRELQVREIGRDIGHPHAGLDGPRDPAESVISPRVT